MFATVHRDEDTEPAEYPEAVPRPSGTRTEAAETPRVVGEDRSATPAEIVAFLSSPM
ncbi:hypothetical protein DWG14_06694 [Streptomyces griseorubiginosus]|uniref:Uncharacterized protein n=1 Tax=Streptomyces griseorubiginosus TaxID=67304 RepID=A0AAI8L3S7_9ACTN|nr:hypothetical protein DWG14_06694 [Streptomyces griseorubiginosus]